MKPMDETAQSNPINVIVVVMETVIVMGLLMLVAGTFMDNFVSLISGIDISLSSWGQGLYANTVTRYSHWVFLIPGAFILLVLAWGVKTVIKKHDYTTQQDQEWISDEYE